MDAVCECVAEALVCLVYAPERGVAGYQCYDLKMGQEDLGVLDLLLRGTRRSINHHRFAHFCS